MKNHKIHTAYLNAIILFEHITIQVLLQTVMSVRRVSQVLKTIQARRPTVNFERVDFVTTFPIIYLISTVLARTNKVQSSRHTRFGIIYTPFGTERRKLYLAFKRLEETPLTRDINITRSLYKLTIIRNIAYKVGSSLAIQVILNLFMEESTSLACHATLFGPGVAQFSCFQFITTTFLKAHPLGIELSKKHTHDTAHRTHIANTVQKITMFSLVKRELAILLKIHI